MPPRASEFAVFCALLVVLHAGAAGVLWVEGGSVSTPPAETADPSADAETLLFAAAHNDAVLPMTSEIRLYHPANDTTVARVGVAADPRAGRARLRVPDGYSSAPVPTEGAYVTPWGRWRRAGDDWTYDGSRHARFESTTSRIFFPTPGLADRIRKRTSDDGTVTVRLDDARTAPGPLSVAGDNATLTYRIAFDDGRPYVTNATARPATADGLAATVERRRGADVRRPDTLPPVTAREIRDRLAAGGAVG
ncbi:hypothetical protein [Natronomonas marina]|uniref:hypothetical protein n=1 Tax=Natronomonas marina TaxID=2961939 RepID=UPI0020C9CDE6|nr:hypothetical protein [Natronomonas marina]